MKSKYIKNPYEGVCNSINLLGCAHANSTNFLEYRVNKPLSKIIYHEPRVHV
jgi:hypothetical protein